MAYQIYKSNGQFFVSIPDGVINTGASSIALPGQNYRGYGDDVVTNWVHMMEHFSNNTPPTSPMTGQIWCDTSVNPPVLKYYNQASSSWILLATGGGSGSFTDVTASGNLAVGGNGIFTGNVSIGGDLDMTGGNISNIDNLTTTGNVSIGGNLDMTGGNISNIDNLTTTGNVSIGGDLDMTGGNISNANVITANAFVGGTFTGTFSGTVTAPGLDTQVIFNNTGALAGDAGFVYDHVNSRVGIGTNTPGEKFVVAGNSSVDIYKLRSNQPVPTITDAFIYRPADNTLAFGTASVERGRFTENGNFGVGTTNPDSYGRIVAAQDGAAVSGVAVNTSGGVSFKLFDSVGTDQLTMIYYGSTYAGGSLFNVGAGGVGIGQMGTGPLSIGTNGAAPFIMGTSGAERSRIDSAGKAMFNTTAVARQAQLTVKGTNFPTIQGRGQLSIMTSDAVALDVGATLILGGQSPLVPGSDGPDWVYASVSGRSENNGYGGYMSLATTRVAGGHTEWVRITSAGNVGIGTTTPTETFEVNGGAFIHTTTTTTGSVLRVGNDSTTDTNRVGINGYVSNVNGATNSAGVYGQIISGTQAVGGQDVIGVFGGINSPVVTDVATYGVVGMNSSNAGTGSKIGVIGRSVGPGGGTNIAVYGDAKNGAINWAGYFEGNVAVDGYSQIITTTTSPWESALFCGYDSTAQAVRRGIRGRVFDITGATSTAAISGLLENGTTTGGDHTAVYGTVNGSVTTTGSSRGVVGVNASAGTGGKIGVLGESNGAGGGTNIGIYGVASGGATNWAGNFVGNVLVDSGQMGVNAVPASDSQFYVLTSNAGRFAGAFENHDPGGFGALALGATLNAGIAYLITIYGNANRLGAPVGYVSTDGTSTVYATTSDYRLKENVEPMTGALDRVMSLKPVTYTWTGTDKVGEGFLAHELQAVCPQAVTGKKDDVDDKGDPRYQGVDTSYLVATLASAIQEQQKIIESLMARITALESK